MVDRGVTTIRLPAPPSVNAAYRNVSGRGRAKTKAYRDWLVEADNYLLAQRHTIGDFSGRLSIRIRIPEKTRGDVSNRIKLIEDFLVSRGVTGDDSNNYKVSIERAAVTCCEVDIEVLV